MSEENKIAEVIKATEGLVKAVPVYEDLVQPTARELGKSLETVAKTINLVLAPLRATIWGADKISEFVNIAVSARLKNLTKGKLIEPNPVIAGPALDALRFAGHNKTLRELYANLLATAMDENTARDAHPSFIEVLKQLAPDEARILSAGFATATSTWYCPYISLQIKFAPGGKGTLLDRFTVIQFEAKCEHPDFIKTYIDNLNRLGLIKNSPSAIPIGALGRLPEELRVAGVLNAGFVDKIFEPLETHSEVLQVLEATGLSKEEVDFTRGGFELTEFGRQFFDACVLSYEHTSVYLAERRAKSRSSSSNRLVGIQASVGSIEVSLSPNE